MRAERGIVNLIKPPSMTSFQAVKAIKRILNVKKVGHTGTLDPAAAGVLAICYGRGTKVIPYLDENRKEYIAVVVLGKTTETLDREGEITAEDDTWQSLTAQEINKALQSFTGKTNQVPPMYSALHHNGQRLYELARKGQEVEREAREIEVYEAELLSNRMPRIRIRVAASKGTYIRSLVRDLGQKLGTCAYLYFLVRIRSGPFFIEEAVTLEEIEQKFAAGNFSFAAAIDDYLEFKKYFILPQARKKAVNGAYLYERDLEDFNFRENNNNEIVLIYSRDKEFISISRIEKDDELVIKPEKVFI